MALFSVPLIPAQAAEMQDYIKYRKELMRLMHKHHDAITKALRNDYPADDLIVHARALHRISGSFGDLFPEGSGKSVKGAYWTKAKPAIWTERAAFDAYLLGLQGYTSSLVEAAEKQDREEAESVRRNMRILCKSCHHEFKNAKKEIVYENE